MICAMLKLLKFLFTLEGRISRKQFWLNYILVMFGLNFVVSFLVVMLTVGFSQLSTLGDVIGVVMFAGLGLIWLLMTLANIWAAIAVSMKRLHDRNMSGWWVLWFLLAVYGGYALGVSMTMNVMGFGAAEKIIGALMLITSLIALITQFIIMGFLPGTVGPNKYGEDPLRPLGVDDVSELFS